METQYESDTERDGNKTEGERCLGLPKNQHADY